MLWLIVLLLLIPFSHTHSVLDDVPIHLAPTSTFLFGSRKRRRIPSFHGDEAGSATKMRKEQVMTLTYTSTHPPTYTHSPLTHTHTHAHTLPPHTRSYIVSPLHIHHVSLPLPTLNILLNKMKTSPMMTWRVWSMRVWPVNPRVNSMNSQLQPPPVDIPSPLRNHSSTLVTSMVVFPGEMLMSLVWSMKQEHQSFVFLNSVARYV